MAAPTLDGDRLALCLHVVRCTSLGAGPGEGGPDVGEGSAGAGSLGGEAFGDVRWMA